MPSSMITSAMRVVIKAFTAAWRGLIFLGSGYSRAYQKPISRYEHRPITSHPINRTQRLSVATTAIMPSRNSTMMSAYER